MIVICPNCEDYVFIESINCGIFRHATYKDGRQFNPHASKEECDKALLKGDIYGCGKPFLIKNNEVHKCAYI